MFNGLLNGNMEDYPTFVYCDDLQLGALKQFFVCWLTNPITRPGKHTKTMEHHHFEWDNSLFLWPFSSIFNSKLLVYQKVTQVMITINHSHTLAMFTSLAIVLGAPPYLVLSIQNTNPPFGKTCEEMWRVCLAWLLTYQFQCWESTLPGLAHKCLVCSFNCPGPLVPVVCLTTNHNQSLDVHSFGSQWTWIWVWISLHVTVITYAIAYCRNVSLSTFTNDPQVQNIVRFRCETWMSWWFWYMLICCH